MDAERTVHNGRYRPTTLNGVTTENLIVSKRQYFSELSLESGSTAHEKTTDKTLIIEQIQDSFNKSSSKEQSDSPDVSLSDDFPQEKELALICKEFADVIEKFEKEVLLAPKENSHKETSAVIEENITSEPPAEEDELLLFALE